MVRLRVVDDRALEVGGEDVAHDADRQVGLLEDERGRLGLVDALLEHLVELEQVLQLALEVLRACAPCAAVRMIAPPPPRSSCLASLRRRSRSLSSSRRETPTPSPVGA